MLAYECPPIATEGSKPTQLVQWVQSKCEIGVCGAGLSHSGATVKSYSTGEESHVMYADIHRTESRRAMKEVTGRQRHDVTQPQLVQPTPTTLSLRREQNIAHTPTAVIAMKTHARRKGAKST